MIIQHHNRILAIIKNDKNEVKHFEAIDRMLENFDKIFGICKLGNNLFRLRNKKYNELIWNEILKK